MRTLQDIGIDENNRISFLAKSFLDFKTWVTEVIQNDGDHKKGLRWEEAYGEWFDMLQNNQFSAVLACRQVGKTEIMAVVYPLYLVFFNKHKEIIIVSKTMDQAKKILFRIKQKIINNELLRGLAPAEKAREQTWTKTEIDTTTGCKMVCKPYNEKILGESTAFIVCDEASKYRDKSIYHKVIMPTVSVTKGHILLIGTKDSETDLIMEASRDSNYIFKEYPIVADDYDFEKMTGIRNFPNTHTHEDIAHLRRTQRYWLREFMLELVTPEEHLYPPNMVIDCFDRKIGFKSVYEGKTLMGCDFAMSKDRHGDFSVFTVIDRVGEMIVIRFIERLKGMTFQGQIAKIENLYHTYKPGVIIVDATTFGAAFLSTLKEKGLPAKGSDFSYRTRNDMLINLRKLIETKKLVIPRDENDPLCMKVTDILYKELISFKETESRTGVKTYQATSMHDDCVMSLALACKGIISQRPVVDYFSYSGRSHKVANKKSSSNNWLDLMKNHWETKKQ